jgi:hypothetical protein
MSNFTVRTALEVKVGDAIRLRQSVFNVSRVHLSRYYVIDEKRTRYITLYLQEGGCLPLADCDQVEVAIRGRSHVE